MKRVEQADGEITTLEEHDRRCREAVARLDHERLRRLRLARPA